MIISAADRATECKLMDGNADWVALPCIQAGLSLDVLAQARAILLHICVTRQMDSLPSILCASTNAGAVRYRRDFRTVHNDFAATIRPNQ